MHGVPAGVIFASAVAEGVVAAGGESLLGYLPVFVMGLLPGLVWVAVLLWRRRSRPGLRAAEPPAVLGAAVRASTPPAVVARRKQEANERTTEVLIRQGLPAARLGGWEHDLVSHRITWSDHIHEIFGRPAESMPTSFAALLECVHADDRDLLEQQSKRLSSSGVPSGCELRIVWPDGSTHWQATRAELVRDGDGRPIRVVGIAMDITERKRIEDELRQSQRLLRVGFDAANVGAWEWDQRSGAVT